MRELLLEAKEILMQAEIIKYLDKQTLKEIKDREKARKEQKRREREE